MESKIKIIQLKIIFMIELGETLTLIGKWEDSEQIYLQCIKMAIEIENKNLIASTLIYK